MTSPRHASASSRSRPAAGDQGRSRAPAPEAPSGVIHVRVVGPPRLFGRRGWRALERHDAALIVRIALDGPAPRAQLAAWLWPDADAPLARDSLRQRLSRLRRAALADGLIDGESTLELAPGTVDLQDTARALAADPTALPGELLEGLDYSDIEGLDDWVGHARERWRRLRLEHLAAAAARLEASGGLAQALRYASRIVADEPFGEVGHRRLMRLHYLRGDRGAALAAARLCADLLASELGVEPDRETRAQIAAIEAADDIGRARVPAPTPMTWRRPPRLVGRASAWRALDSTVARHAGILVLGDAGIGKTRLLEDYVRSRDDLLHATAWPGDDHLPYATLARLATAAMERHGPPADGWIATELARLVPALGPPPQGVLDTLRLQAALGAELRRWRGAGLAAIVLDDLHHADPATLQLLPPLVDASIGPTAVSWVLASRPDELPPSIAAWATRASSERLARLTLPALSSTDVDELLESIGDVGPDPSRWTTSLHRHTGGNPFLIVETLLALRHDGSASAQPPPRWPVTAFASELVARHLAKLERRPLQLARVLALAGQDGDDAFAERVLAWDTDALDAGWAALEDARLLVDGRIAHELLRDGLLDSIPPATARGLHGRITERLTELATTNDARAWSLERQSEIALFARDDELAEVLTRRALALAEHSTNGWIALCAGKKLAFALLYTGRHDEALAQLARHRPFAEANLDHWNAWAFISDSATADGLLDRYDEAYRGFERLIEEWEKPREDRYGLYGTACAIALLRYHQGDLAAAVAGYDAALAEAADLDPAFATGNPRGALRRAGVWRDAGRLGASLATLESAMAGLVDGTNAFLSDACEDQLALTLLELGDLAHAAALCAREPASGHPEAHASRALVRRRVARLRGHPSPPVDATSRYVVRRIALGLRLESARIAAPRESLDASLSVIEEAAANGLHGLALHARWIAAEASDRLGDPPAASRHLEQALAESERWHPTGLSRAEGRAIAAALLNRLGDAARARAVVDRAVAELRALDDIPDERRRAFWHDHPVHRALLEAHAGPR